MVNGKGGGAEPGGWHQSAVGNPPGESKNLAGKNQEGI